ncbi:TetR/AcrR family transcriptional regulator [Streptomyces niveus]|uniref:TetR/AcrR family transcriptional regulator n=1 Tax=Streptomyces niveus TaxID=193462 RepID=UPI0036C438F6
MPSIPDRVPDPDPGPDSLVVRRVPRSEVRRRLLAAAARAFAGRGYDDSRLEDIARDAGFTKGAVYSNFGSKDGLFGAVLAQGADAENDNLMAAIRHEDQAPKGNADAVTAFAARAVANRIVGDVEHGRLGLEFAARSARDEGTRAVLTPIRRAQRDAAARAFAEVAERTGARPAVSPELAALIVHCLTNGLSNEHIADPDEVGATEVENALATVLGALMSPPSADAEGDA